MVLSSVAAIAAAWFMLAPVAADAPSGSDPVSWLINYGVAGVIIILLVTGQLRTKAEVEGLKAELIKKDESITAKDAALTALVTQLTTFLPQLAKVGDVVEALPKNGDAQLATVLREISARLDDIQSNGGH